VNLIGSWDYTLSGNARDAAYRGRTIEVGRKVNGKMLRAYEKGPQLGQWDSPHFRLEVQFGNKDRVLPFDMLTDPTRFFVGAYPAFELLDLEQAGERIKTLSSTLEITLGKVLTWMRNSAGKWADLFVSRGVDPAELVEAIRVTGLPRRVSPSVVATGCMADSVQNGFENWSTGNGTYQSNGHQGL
jgi:phage replication initiation protein